MIGENRELSGEIVVNWRPTDDAYFKMVARGIPGSLVEEVLEHGRDTGSGKVPGSTKRDLILEDGRIVRVISFSEAETEVVFSVQWLEKKKRR